MNEEDNPPNPPPGTDAQIIRKILWLLAAFLPSIIAITCLPMKNLGPGMFWFLAITNLVCSTAASAGLMAGIKGDGARFFWVLLLIPFFFILNIVIVVFVGCSGMGRISP